MSGKLCNPVTLSKKPDPKAYTCNPLTGRLIKVDGKLYKKLVKENILGGKEYEPPSIDEYKESKVTERKSKHSKVIKTVDENEPLKINTKINYKLFDMAIEFFYNDWFFYNKMNKSILNPESGDFSDDNVFRDQLNKNREELVIKTVLSQHDYKKDGNLERDEILAKAKPPIKYLTLVENDPKNPVNYWKYYSENVILQYDGTFREYVDYRMLLSDNLFSNALEIALAIDSDEKGRNVRKVKGQPYLRANIFRIPNVIKWAVDDLLSYGINADDLRMLNSQCYQKSKIKSLKNTCVTQYSNSGSLALRYYAWIKQNPDAAHPIEYPPKSKRKPRPTKYPTLGDIDPVSYPDGDNMADWEIPVLEEQYMI